MFVRGANLLKRNTPEKAWPMLKKAIQAGIYPDQEVMIASGFIQHGDVESGMQILDNVEKKCSIPDVLHKLSVTRSMGFWREGKLKEAISELENLFDSGFVDNNLLINICTYLLEMGDMKKAKKYLAECRKRCNVLTTGMEDNQGWYYMLAGEMEKARKLYSELINDRQPKFPEAYVHGAQVSIYFERYNEAVERLGWATSKRFTHTCAYNLDYVTSLINGISNPATSKDFIKAINDNMKLVALGRAFPGFEKAVEFEGDEVSFESDNREYFDEESASVDDEIETSVDERMPDTTPSEDEREPNTDL